MATRHFTPDEANALLAEVGPVAEELVEHRRAMTEAAARRAQFVHRVAGNGGDFDPGEPKADAELFEREAEGVTRCVERLEALGVLVKDLDSGLVGFAAQRTIGNFIAGLLIAFTQPIRIGDHVEIDDTEGVVEEIGLTYTFIRVTDNDRLVIPNDRIASDTILNSTIRGRKKLAHVTVQVPLDRDLTAVSQLLRDAADDERAEVRVTSLEDGARLELSVWAADEPSARRLESELRLRAHERLREAGVYA